MYAHVAPHIARSSTEHDLAVGMVTHTTRRRIHVV
jgi:hypothetical protein